MNRGIAIAFVGLISLAGGCAGQARMVNYDDTTGSGTVAIANNTDVWPSYNMRAAKAMIESKVGPNYRIVSQGEVVTGQSTQNTQQTSVDQTQNKRNPNLPGLRETTTGTTTTQDIKEYRLTFVRVAPQGGPMGGMPGPGGVMQTGGTVPGAGLPQGTVPSPLPIGMQPVGGMQSPFAGGRP